MKRRKKLQIDMYMDQTPTPIRHICLPSRHGPSERVSMNLTRSWGLITPRDRNILIQIAQNQILESKCLG